MNGLKQFHESLNVMLPHYQAFMQTDADVQLMLDAWLGTLNFVMARGMLRHFDAVRRATFDRQIDAAEALALSSHGEQIASLVRKSAISAAFRGRSSKICSAKLAFCQKRR